MARWPWSRQPSDKSQLPGKVPKEVEDYYESGKRERVGVAWLLALGTLLVTVLLAAVLFFGGRWVYRTVFTNNDSGQTAQEEGGDSAEQSPAGSGERSGDSNQDANNGDNQATDNGTNQSSSQESEGGEGASGTSSQTTDGTAQTDTPATGPTATEVPNTGPEGTVAIVAIASLTGAAAHNVISRLRTKHSS